MIRGKKLGEGTYGIVYSADSPNGSRKYALKRNLAEQNTTFLSSARELDLLNRLRRHPHIVRLEKVAFSDVFQNDIFSPLVDKTRQTQRNDNVHFVFEEANYDLYSFIHNADYIDYRLSKRYMVNILLAIEYMHESKIIHRDIKPSNILIFGNEPDALGIKNVAKVCDFGLSKPFTYQGNQTPSVVTSWYRAPEILLNQPWYDYKVDVWSLGCMFYEMIAKKSFIEVNTDMNEPLLKAVLKELPKEVTVYNYRKILTFIEGCGKDRLGYPPPKVNRSLKRKPIKEKLCLTSAGMVQFEKEAGSLNLFCDLLLNMIKFEWTERYTVTQCLDHPFFDDHRDVINQTRNKYIPTTLDSYLINLKPCIERKWMANIAIQLLDEYEKDKHRELKDLKVPWYSHRALFQAMDLFDRYLLAMFSSKEISPNAVESEYKGLIHDQRGTLLRFMSCIYLSIKYFSTIHTVVPFDNIVPDFCKTNQSKLQAESFETGLIVNCLGYEIYRDTIYEAADSSSFYLSDEHVRDLVTLYSNSELVSGLTPRQVISYYEDHLNNKQK